MRQQRRGGGAAGAAAAPQPAAPVVAQRLCDVLLTFPSSATGGVQWQVLVRKYEERYSTRLDLAALGQSSPLAAAIALLWEVLRLVDKEDTDNPVVAIDDAVALVPRPGVLGCWPSLYHALCDIVLANGAPAEAAREGAATGEPPLMTRKLLLSQLRPLLERHWHPSFDESAFGFLSETGTFTRLKKMKHLLHAVLRWRAERREWQQAHGLKPTAVDEVLQPTLELVPSDKHNDLLLFCSAPGELGEGRAALCSYDSAGASSADTPSVASQASSEAAQPSSLGGAPSAELRCEEEAWAGGQTPRRSGSQATSIATPVPSFERLPAPQLMADIFDDPFEPPPEMPSWRVLSKDLSSTDFGSEASFEESSAHSTTPRSWQPSESASTGTSGAATPAHAAAAPGQQHSCTFVPMWFPLMPGAPSSFVDMSVIPQGIVQTAREHFERMGQQLVPH